MPPASSLEAQQSAPTSSAAHVKKMTAPFQISRPEIKSLGRGYPHSGSFIRVVRSFVGFRCIHKGLLGALVIEILGKRRSYVARSAAQTNCFQQAPQVICSREIQAEIARISNASLRKPGLELLELSGDHRGAAN